MYLDFGPQAGAGHLGLPLLPSLAPLDDLGLELVEKKVLGKVSLDSLPFEIFLGEHAILTSDRVVLGAFGGEGPGVPPELEARLVLLHASLPVPALLLAQAQLPLEFGNQRGLH